MGEGVTTAAPNSLMAAFSDTVTAGFEALQGPVDRVFGLLIVLVVALTGVQWALSPQREVLAAGFSKVLLIGAFAWLINDWARLSETIYVGFLELGLAAGGGSLSRADFLNPGAILEQGWAIVRTLGETPAPLQSPLDVAGNLTDALILGLAMVGIMLAFAVLALQVVVTLLEFKIVTLGGFVLLPFGIWSKSAFLAERPLGYVAAAGLKVLALAIVVSGARSVFDQLQPSANPDLYEALAILAAALLLAMLAIFIPSLAAALVTGGPALGAGAAATGGLAVGGAGLLGLGGAAVAGRLTTQAGSSLALAARAAAGEGTRRLPPAPPGARSSAPTPAPPGPPRPAGTGAPSNDNPRPPPAPASMPPSAQAVPQPAAGLEEPPSSWSGAAAPPDGGAPESPPSTSRKPGSDGGSVANSRAKAPFPEEAAPDSADASTGPSSSRVPPAENGSASGEAAASAEPAGDPSERRREARIAAEAQAARADFHKALQAEAERRRPQAVASRSAALQAFFAANAARGLLPGAESSGSASPDLKKEEP
jgi:type IV secretion system protein TrbL